MKIAVVDDHDLIREGLNAVLLNHCTNYVKKYGTDNHLVDSMDAGERFDFYIVDLELPDIDGFLLIEMIRARDVNARIIVSTVHDEIWTLRKLLAREVDGIIEPFTVLGGLDRDHMLFTGKSDYLGFDMGGVKYSEGMLFTSGSVRPT